MGGVREGPVGPVGCGRVGGGNSGVEGVGDVVDGVLVVVGGVEKVGSGWLEAILSAVFSGFGRSPQPYMNAQAYVKLFVAEYDPCGTTRPLVYQGSSLALL